LAVASPWIAACDCAGAVCRRARGCRALPVAAEDLRAAVWCVALAEAARRLADWHPAPGHAVDRLGTLVPGLGQSAGDRPAGPCDGSGYGIPAGENCARPARPDAAHVLAVVLRLNADWRVPSLQADLVGQLQGRSSGASLEHGAALLRGLRHRHHRVDSAGLLRRLADGVGKPGARPAK